MTSPAVVMCHECEIGSIESVDEPTSESVITFYKNGQIVRIWGLEYWARLVLRDGMDFCAVVAVVFHHLNIGNETPKPKYRMVINSHWVKCDFKDEM